jgi:hypothetical protein
MSEVLHPNPKTVKERKRKSDTSSTPNPKIQNAPKHKIF